MTKSTAKNPLVAVDVGNSRVKWGVFESDKLLHVASLPHLDESAYDRQLELWQLADTRPDWSIASVNTSGLDGMRHWLTRRGFESVILEDPALLPLRVEVDRPGAVGIDRLLDAVAANARRPAGRAAVIVD